MPGRLGPPSSKRQARLRDLHPSSTNLVPYANRNNGVDGCNLSVCTHATTEKIDARLCDGKPAFDPNFCGAIDDNPLGYVTAC
jgi:hypothetical protein